MLSFPFFSLSGNQIAVKILEDVHEMLEEIEEETRTLRDLSQHPNLPTFHGVFITDAPCKAHSTANPLHRRRRPRQTQVSARFWRVLREGSE